MPQSLHALTLLRTYTWLAGLSPTKITANPGVMPCALMAATRCVTSVRIWAARALPSIICAVIRVSSTGRGMGKRVRRVPACSGEVMRPRPLQSPSVSCLVAVRLHPVRS